jgi:hypothetical protein
LECGVIAASRTIRAVIRRVSEGRSADWPSLTLRVTVFFTTTGKIRKFVTA